MIAGIMRSYSPEEATIILVEQRRANVGVVPQEWLSAYGQNAEHIRDIVKDLCAVLDTRRPPPTATPEQLATQRFWSGREVFVVVDGITSWGTNINPLTELAPYVGEAEDLGLHLVVSADIRQFGYQSQGYGVLGRTANMAPPILVMNGDRSHGAVVTGVFAQPQREGKGQLVTRAGVQGVLVGWSEPPLAARRRPN